ncbi:OstA-like protein [Cellvibrio sp. BR]|jgi:lipopolysaccharide export system protein LptA|uniref:lipopolysaccharide transport periplasmic protein LptA n=1 Tax=unclassified Cellvibrio TaxID=2624793 RepID=UPI00026008C0|nr:MULTISPECIES: lipopolysaccharide transport periplasmic protein LptA [unclassified Cellvibrio]EIK44405.1 OstA-like protein [Cellvibrio sp. BR]QEY13919.1 lipopolysaccharide transport periplasmic protein LptA [Cellvibrio sp. KY-YJ-3]UUA74524.1 lipopolysaccharide transport periplasmic protein LptA [Cellvibrio sp. QJXJ]
MNRAKSLLKILPLLAGLCCSVTAWALPSDKNETIRGSADNLTVDQKNGVATYTGSVEIRQGSLIINADSIIIHTNNEGGVEKMIATGSPAKFQQQPEAEQGVVTASAKQITYTPNNEHLLLIEDASVEQNGAVMSGPHIDYDLVKEVMKAEGNNTGEGQRIEIVIPPKSAKPEDLQAPSSTANSN